MPIAFSVIGSSSPMPNRSLRMRLSRLSRPSSSSRNRWISIADSACCSGPGWRVSSIDSAKPAFWSSLIENTGCEVASTVSRTTSQFSSGMPSSSAISDVRAGRPSL